MNKEEYFAKGKKQGFSPRCPLVGKCERYAATKFFSLDTMK